MAHFNVLIFWQIFEPKSLIFMKKEKNLNEKGSINVPFRAKEILLIIVPPLYYTERQANI